VNSTGRGRLKVSSESNRFTYQAASKNQKYTLGIDIPFKGQETLVLPLNENGELGGSLYEKISDTLLGKRKLKTVRLFDKFLLSSANFFSSIEKIQRGECKADKCLKGTVSQTDSGEVYRSAWSKNYELVVKFKRLNEGQYKSVRVQAVNLKSKKSPLALDLAIERCL
jgi:hypothetical protein